MISAEQLVPDDTITVESGDKLPTDLRLVDG
jgi:magnesium-transporting ATPase (P-type)